MRIVLITSKYPYGNYEEFLHTEVQYMLKRFDNIVIISGAESKENIREIASSIQVVRLNRYYRIIQTTIGAILEMLSWRTLKEITNALSQKQYSIQVILKEVFLYYLVSQRQFHWIWKHVKRTDKDIIIYSYWLASSAFALARLKEKGFTFKAISRAHGGDAFIDRGYQPFRDYIVKWVDEVYFVSQTAKNMFSAHYNNCNAELLVSRLGTEKLYYANNPVNGTEGVALHIVSCSMIKTIKRIDLLIDALCLIEGKRILWTHIGDGPKEDEIKRYAKKRITSSNIEYRFLGYISNSKIQEFYNQVHIDLFINCSDGEGVPVSLMEAICYGIPVIARDVGGNKEIVKHGKNGILLGGSAGAKEIAEAILKVSSLSSDEISSYRSEAVNTWGTLYNAKDNYSRFFNTILQPKKKT